MPKGFFPDLSMSAATRRSFLKNCAIGCASALSPYRHAALENPQEESLPLKQLSGRSGKLVGMFSGQHELMNDSTAAKLIGSEFDMLSIGNDLKMNRIHPQPDAYNFSYGDWDVEWSQRSNLLFRAHTLIWHNALPGWFNSYVNAANAEHVMTEHITTVVRHYAGKVYSWDVVNEPIHHDGRPDELRRKPWLDLVGPDYIEIAFRAAAAADPKARLVVNECYIEHDLPVHAQRRDALLQLASRLKKSGVPISGVGIQGHIKADTPLDFSGMKNFLTALDELNLEILITELDVDDSNIPAAEIDRAVAQKYAEFLDLVAPFAKVINFEQFADNPALPKRSDGLPHRPNLFDSSYQRKPAYSAVAKAIGNLHK
jgi:endo-1,4-beta-xylanase